MLLPTLPLVLPPSLKPLEDASLLLHHVVSQLGNLLRRLLPQVLQVHRHLGRDVEHLVGARRRNGFGFLDFGFELHPLLVLEHSVGEVVRLGVTILHDHRFLREHYLKVHHRTSPSLRSASCHVRSLSRVATNCWSMAKPARVKELLGWGHLAVGKVLEEVMEGWAGDARHGQQRLVLQVGVVCLVEGTARLPPMG